MPVLVPPVPLALPVPPAAGPAGPTGEPANVGTTEVQFETCGGCHRDAGEEHQVYYNRLYQDGVIQVTNVTYKFTAAAGDKTDTTVVTFKMTKDGKPISGASVENSNIYFAAYTGTDFRGRWKTVPERQANL